MPVSCGKPLLGPVINTLEIKYNTPLPDDYRKFLEKENGFVIKSPDFSELIYDGVDEGVIAFRAFFGIGTKNHYNDINYHNDNFLNEINFLEEKIIIGDDSGGNYFLIVNIDNQKAFIIGIEPTYIQRMKFKLSRYLKKMTAGIFIKSLMTFHHFTNWSCRQPLISA